MSELKVLNCPFCGDAPQVLPKVQDYGPRVMCRNHKCRLDASFAVEAWNQRDTSAIEAAVLRRVADECEQVNGEWTCITGNGLREEADRIEKGRA